MTVIVIFLALSYLQSWKLLKWNLSPSIWLYGVPRKFWLLHCMTKCQFSGVGSKSSKILSLFSVKQWLTSCMYPDLLVIWLCWLHNPFVLIPYCLELSLSQPLIHEHKHNFVVLATVFFLYVVCKINSLNNRKK